MVASTEVGSNFFEGVTGHMAREKHRDLPRIGDGLRPAFRLQVDLFDTVVAGDDGDHVFHCGLATTDLEQIL